MATMIHFGSYDDRFCGTQNTGRQFTVDPNKVTCPSCKAKDTFTLSPAGQSALDRGPEAFDEWVKNG